MLGKLVLDEEDHSISIAGDKIDFTLTEFKLIHYFLKRKGRVQTRDNLLLGVWKFDAEVETLLQEAIAAAQEAPYPSAEDMLTDVYVQER